jgi:hypothetical protein
MDILANIPNTEFSKPVVTYNADELDEKDFYAKHVLLNKPCLIKGAVKQWQATKKWSQPGYLAAKVDDPAVSLYEHSNYLHPDKMAKTEQKIAFNEALAKLTDNKGGTVSIPSIFCDEKGKFAAFLDDLGAFAFIQRLAKPIYYPQRRFFMYAGAGTTWHYHQIDETLMCQIKGSKRVGLLAPLNPSFDRLEEDLMTYQYLEGDQCFADYKGDIQPFEVLVEEGDALYIPPFWWHGVEPVDTDFGITMAHCWASPLHKLAAFEVPIIRRTWKTAFTSYGMATLMVLRYGVQALLSRLWFKLTHPSQNGIE